MRSWWWHFEILLRRICHSLWFFTWLVLSAASFWPLHNVPTWAKKCPISRMGRQIGVSLRTVQCCALQKQNWSNSTTSVCIWASVCLLVKRQEVHKSAICDTIAPYVTPRAGVRAKLPSFLYGFHSKFLWTRFYNEARIVVLAKKVHSCGSSSALT